MNPAAMASLLPEVLSTQQALFGLIILVLPFLITRIWSNLNANRSRNGEPPMVPYTIPWFGHGYFFLSDMNGLASWVKKCSHGRDALTVLVGGKHLYTILDPKLVSMIYQRPRSFMFDPLAFSANEGFGAVKADIDVMRMGVPGTPQYRNDGRRVVAELHQQLHRYLMGVDLVFMASKFVETLTANLEKEFAEGGIFGSSEEWVTLDMCDFYKRQFTLASMPLLFGRHFMKVWPRVYEEFWEFDKHAQKLLLNPPRALLPTPFATRDKALSALRKWRDDAYKYGDFKSVEAANPDWDEYWGSRLIRARHRVFAKNGFSKSTMCALDLGLLWGQNANAAPVGIWMLLHCVCDGDLQQRVRSAIASCQRPDGTFDMDSLVTNYLLKSIFLETLRFCVASPSVRAVVETTEVGSYTFHKGNVVFLPGRELQMDADVWSPGGGFRDPSEFWADRFLDSEKDDNGDVERAAEPFEANEEYAMSLDDATTNTTHTSSGRGQFKASTEAMFMPGPQSKAARERMQSLRPFGGGSSLCPGRQLSMYEVIAGLAIILSTFDVEVDKEALSLNGMPRLDLSIIGAMGPDRKLIVKMKKRNR